MKGRLPWLTSEACYRADEEGYKQPTDFRYELAAACEPTTALVLLIIRRAIADLTSPPDPKTRTSPLEARRFLVEDAPGLLESLGLGHYADRLVRLVNETPEPLDPCQLTLEL